MKVVYLTAGTGSFYCGNCLRDMALARGLRALGHDVVMTPLYLPTVSEEGTLRRAEQAPIFFGGVSVYLHQRGGLWAKMARWGRGALDARWRST